MITKLQYCRNYSARKQSNETEKKISDLQFKQITTQEDHNIHMYCSLCLVVLTEENSIKPLLLVTYRNQVYLFLHF